MVTEVDDLRRNLVVSGDSPPRRELVDDIRVLHPIHDDLKGGSSGMRLEI